MPEINLDLSPYIKLYKSTSSLCQRGTHQSKPGCRWGHRRPGRRGFWSISWLCHAFTLIIPLTNGNTWFESVFRISAKFTGKADPCKRRSWSHTMRKVWLTIIILIIKTIIIFIDRALFTNNESHMTSDKTGQKNKNQIWNQTDQASLEIPHWLQVRGGSEQEGLFSSGIVDGEFGEENWDQSF